MILTVYLKENSEVVKINDFTAIVGIQDGILHIHSHNMFGCVDGFFPLNNIKFYTISEDEDNDQHTTH